MHRTWIGFIAACVLAVPAIAQLSITGIGPAGGVAVNTNCTSYTGIGDIVSGASSFIGVRAYNSTSCNIRALTIRRASDNTTLDINILTTGKLDTATATTFCNATSCFITTWYDQTGNGNDVKQNTNANQPALTFNCINTSLPCVTFNGSTDVMNALNCSVSAFPATSATFSQRTGGTSSFSSVYNPCFDGSHGDGLYLVNSVNTQGCTWGVSGTNDQETVADNAWHGLECAATSANQNFVIDGTNHANTSGGTYATGVPASVGNAAFTGTVTEVFSYASAISVANMQSFCHNESLFYGTPTC